MSATGKDRQAMAYCRWTNESDVYVYVGPASGDATRVSIICCACSLNDSDSDYHFDHYQDVIDHLGAHREAGEKVKDTTFERLNAERAKYGDVVWKAWNKIIKDARAR